MDIISTSALEVSIHAVSPGLGTGALPAASAGDAARKTHWARKNAPVTVETLEMQRGGRRLIDDS